MLQVSRGKSRETRQVSLKRGPKGLIRGLVMGKCKSQWRTSKLETLVTGLSAKERCWPREDICVL